MTRIEHMIWCKKRALEYIDVGDLPNAFTSMTSDLTKHPETENHAGIERGTLMMLNGLLDTPLRMRNFIDGFH